MRADITAVLIEVETEVEELASAEIDLIPGSEEVAALGVAGRAGLRAEDRKTRVFFMLTIEKIARGQNVGRREIHLDFRNVSGTPEVVGVLP